jgi:hypothetical protein
MKVTLSAKTYKINIGAGGAGGSGGGVQGRNGDDTVLSDGGTELLNAKGGGGGGSGYNGNSNLSGISGGSGGGGGNGSSGNYGTGGAATSTQGNNGGTAVSGSNHDAGAGGGGAGGAGQGTAAGGGAGGLGIELEVLSALLENPNGTLYASGGKGGGRTATPAIDGQNYGDGGGAPCHTTTIGSAVPGKAGHAGILYVAIPYTNPAQ